MITVRDDWDTVEGRDAILARLRKLRDERGCLSDAERDDIESVLQIGALDRAIQKRRNEERKS